MEHETIDIAAENEQTIAAENEETKLVPITALLEMAASRLGVVVCGWAAAVMVQGGIVSMLQTKDRVFVTVMFLLVCFRYWGNFCPQATDGSLTETSRSLSANNRQEMAVPIHFISRFFYWCKLVSAMTSVGLSMMRLASHDFGQTEVANKADRDFTLNVFYGLALVEALLLLFALTFVTIMAMQRTVTEVLFEWIWPESSPMSVDCLPSPSDLSPNDHVSVDGSCLPELDISNLDIPHTSRLRANIVFSDTDSWSDYAFSDIAISESDDLARLESDDFAWFESDDISLRHPHSDFEFELI